jgi:hypothetical protein
VSAKLQALEDFVTAAMPGPWVWFGEFINGWRLGTGGFGYARYCPLDNSVEMLFDLTCSGAALGDNTQIATMPETDSAGNSLRPKITLTINCMADHCQSGVSPRMRIAPGGAITIVGLTASAPATTWLRATCVKYTRDDVAVN